MLETPIIPFRKASLWGVCNANRQILIDYQFEFAFSPVQDADGSWLILVKNAQQHYGWVWWCAEKITVVQPRFQLDIMDWFGDSYQEDNPTGQRFHVDRRLIPVLAENKNWGYVSRVGDEMIAPIFAEAKYFFNERAVVSICTQFGIKKWGVIDARGEWLLQPTYSYISYPYDGLRIFKRHIPELGGRFGYLDNQTGQEVIPAQFFNAKGFVDGLAVVKNKKTLPDLAVINRQGHIVMANLSDAKHGCASVIAVCRDKRWGVINQEGEMVLPFVFADATLPSEAMMGLKKGRKWAVYSINTSGRMNEMVAPSYKLMMEYSHGYAWAMDEKNQTFYIDKLGKLVHFEEKSDVPEKFYYNRCLVLAYSDNLHGYVNQYGKLIIGRKYIIANNFELCGLASVVTSNDDGIKTGYGFIDNTGIEYWQD